MMKTTHRRIALLAGASVAALSATPALAAPHDAFGTGTAAGTNTTSDTVTICALATNVDCFFGVYHSGAAVEAAAVNSPANGEVIQHDTAANVTLTMTNAAGDNAEVGAIASATNTTGNATAGASVAIGVAQSAHATTGDADINFSNLGTLTIDAIADADASGVANANAGVNIGIAHIAQAADAATIDVVNSGPLHVLASANATGETANAAAAVFAGHYEVASVLPGGTLASVDYVNNDLEAVSAVANANAGSGAANAAANISLGVVQGAAGGTAGTGTANFTNNDTLNVIASGNAVSTGGAADATAGVRIGLAQTVGGTVANATINNAAGAAIAELAHAKATGTAAHAVANLGDGGTPLSAGILQLAGASFPATDANLTLSNAGTISLTAEATAVANSGSATATAMVDGLRQDIVASGAGTANFTNSGGYTVLATANADAADGPAFADAEVSYGVSQEVTALTATANISNGAAGNIDIGAVANATGTQAGHNYYSWWGGTASLTQGASANVNVGLGQHVHAAGTYTTTTTGGATVTVAGNAVAAITNDGTIDIHATANANAAGTAPGGGGLALAKARVGTGITQEATATGGDATVSLTNGGTININASANATGSTAYAYNSILGVSPGAGASVGVGIHQTAQANPAVIGSATYTTTYVTHPTPLSTNTFTNTYTYGTAALAGNASVALTNSGAINIGATANAIATAGTAEAHATVTTGIQQNAVAGHATLGTTFGTGTTSVVGGDASVSLANNGSIAINAAADASATSYASAAASVGRGIGQDAYADMGDASASITGTGTIDVAAHAHALSTDSDAYAYATVGSGITQYAQAGYYNGTTWTGGGDATAIISQGAVNISAVASAAGTYAYADAQVDFGVWQGAWAINGSASASMALDGGSIAAHASVNGTNQGATAYATVGNNTWEGAAISQYAWAGNGDASVNFTNTGALTIDASAKALADETANAYADVDGLYQYASAYNGVGDANVTFSNTGTMAVSATATATGRSANATANASFGVYQSADAWGGGDANLKVVNDGSLSVGANAFANATAADANATADVGTGVYQVAHAHQSGDAIAALTNAGSIAIAAVATANAGTRVVGVGTTATTVLGAADANASVEYGLSQVATGINATASLSNTAAGVIDVSASANAGGAVATGTATDAAMTATAASAHAVAHVETGVYQAATGNGTYTTTTTVAGPPVVTNTFTYAGAGSASLTNAGAINVSAIANATATGPATATASVDYGVYQTVSGGAASAVVDNSGTIAVAATANADGGTANAVANAGDAIHQVVNAAPVVLGTATYTTTYVTHPTPLATNTFTNTYTYNTAALASDAAASVTNSGTISVNANANAVGSAGADAAAYAGTGVFQQVAANTVVLGPTTAGGATTVVSGNASASVVNSGMVAINAMASASATGAATAFASAAPAVYQDVTAAAGSAVASVTNSGTLSANATAHAVGTLVTTHPATGTATATTTTTAGAASAVAKAIGIGQVVSGATGSANIVNSGAINVGANATATGGSTATANALAMGAFQHVTNPVALNFTNSGTMDVAAVANAAAATGNAGADAYGYTGYASGGGTAYASVSNAGTMNVSATAVAPGTALALAQGIVVSNAATTTTVAAVPPATVSTVNVNGQPLVASITNSGTLNVVANASGMGTTTTTTTVGVGTTAVVTTHPHPHSAATATGIRLAGGVLGTTTTTTAGTPPVATKHYNNSSITNSGTLNVDAITANGGPATANGILVVSNGTATPTANQVLTVTNDGGTIQVRQSTDGGATWHRGMAIDVTDAPVDHTVINLLGDGNIYGNIAVNDGDVINVQDGTTVFDGIVNPSCMPAGGPTALTYDNAALSGCGVGTMNIDNGGNLELVSGNADATMDDGPSYVFVDTLNVGMTGTDGTITYDLNPTTGGNQPIGTYPQIYADVANLGPDSHLVANITVPGGLYADSYFWNNVIDANTRNGTFGTCEATGINPDSIFLDFACTYEDGNVDLGLERTPFDEIAGLTPNEQAVAGGLECLYTDANLATLAGTPTGEALASLFDITTPAQYAAAVNQLTGASYAGYLQSFNTLGYHYNAILDRATDCEVPALAGSALECRTAPMHIWAQLDYDRLKKDGDLNLESYHADRWTALIGFDANVGTAAVLGISGGYVRNEANFNDFGSSDIKGDGWQVGAYGVYDPGAFYVKALGTYSHFSGKSKRTMSWAGLGFGGTLAGTSTAGPDVNLWTFGLHSGYRMAMSPTSVITPFLNYDYTDAKLKSFVETGMPALGLEVNGGSSKHSWLTGGVKWAGQMGGIVPEVSIAWRHMFGDRTASFNANFAGFANCDFDIVSAMEKRDAILGGLSIGGKVGPADIRVGYLGAFNSDYTEHSGYLKVVVPLGAPPAPPPPPVAAPPPPPPAPATQTCPDGSVILATDTCPAPPPPPPPPPPAPERG